MLSSAKYVEVFKEIIIQPDSRLLALWYYCKQTADEYGVPDVLAGTFPKSREELYKSLWELRNNLENYVRKESVEYIKRSLESRTPEELYSECFNHINRRSMGEFFTPQLIARRMVSFSEKKSSIFDIGVGTGTFLKEAAQLGYKDFMGIEISPILCDIARYNLRDFKGKLKIIWGDFLLEKDLPQADLWISNPPYTRHHQIPLEIKEEYLKNIQSYGFRISRISSLYAFFFVRIIHEREKWSKATFICPRSLYDSVHSKSLKKWLLKHKIIIALEVFHDQKIFEDAETGPVITYLDSEEHNTIIFRNCLLERRDITILSEKSRKIAELDPFKPWTNIAVSETLIDKGIRLGELFTIMRGVATGANKYFVLSEAEVKKYNLPQTVLIPTIAKTRYCLKKNFTKEDWERLRAEGKEVYLLDLSRDKSSPSVRAYIELGKKMGIASRSLVKTRKKWYQMEKRAPPPIFVTYLSRKRPRFILNEAGVIPLNVFLCLYPKINLTEDCIKGLWEYLNSEDAIKQFNYLARNYGEDTLKVEPRILDLLVIPYELIKTCSCLSKYIQFE